MSNIPPERNAKQLSGRQTEHEVVWEDGSSILSQEQALAEGKDEHDVSWPPAGVGYVDFVCERTPRCTDLIADPKGVLQNEDRWPVHLCEEFLHESTRWWAEEQPFVGRNVEIIQQWSNMHPLPIGRRALMIRRDVDNLSEWAEVYSVLPFDEYQKAMWALRVEGEWSPTNEYALDLFGLAQYPTETHRKHNIPVVGDLAYAVRGRGQLPLEFLHMARRWWSQFKGLAMPGRPLYSGTWSSTDEFKAELDTAVRGLCAQGRKVTQEAVAEILRRDIKTLTRWLKKSDLKWNNVRRC